MISAKSIEGVVGTFEEAMNLLRNSEKPKCPPVHYRVTRRFRIYGRSIKPKRNGVGIAYEYWDWKKREYVILADESRARQCGNGTCTKVWVWYVDGEVSNKLTPEEIRLYCP